MSKILVVDDTPTGRKNAVLTLKRMGHEIVEAENAMQAIKALQHERFDFILTDMSMPTEEGEEDPNSGLEVIKAAKSADASAKVIVMTAYGTIDNAVEAMRFGAYDYLTKPFSNDELAMRVQRALGKGDSSWERPSVQPTVSTAPGLKRVSSGNSAIDSALNGGIPIGSNLLILGPVGSGKSNFCRQFIAEGLKRDEKTMFIAVDDNPDYIRQALLRFHHIKSIKDYEAQNQLCFIDAYSWCAGIRSEEKYAITGLLDLNQLYSVIADAGAELGQSSKEKLGGRRALDSISSLLVTFELPSVQRFIARIARTAAAYGGVTTLFVLEKGAVDEERLNNIKYLMDGAIEFSREEDDERYVRISHMKWIAHTSNLLKL